MRARGFGFASTVGVYVRVWLSGACSNEMDLYDQTLSVGLPWKTRELHYM